MIIDLSELPHAVRYEDRYQQYMDIFKKIAHTHPDEEVHVESPPYSWLPLLFHLNCRYDNAQIMFEHCDLVAACYGENWFWNRTAVEVLCGFRPECVDALWKCDMQWITPKGRIRDYPTRQEFIVTNNGSFHRDEIKNYMGRFATYRPTKENVLIVPCAADKPYPSPMHKACMELMPDDFYIMNATGVLGLVPEDLWHVMPWYDSGIPNEWRLFGVVKYYFSRFPHKKIVVYCDFYSPAIWEALHSINVEARFVLPIQRYDDYVNLMDPARLIKLESALNTW